MKTKTDTKNRKQARKVKNTNTKLSNPIDRQQLSDSFLKTIDDIEDKLNK